MPNTTDLMSMLYLKYPHSCWTSRATWRLIAGRMWPAGRTLCTTDLYDLQSVTITQVWAIIHLS